MKAPTNYRNEVRKRTVRGAPQVGKHHGEGPSDGAQRNARIAAMNAERREQSRINKETIIAKRTAAAEKRKKETLAMATEDTKLNEAKHVFHVHMKSDDDRQHKMVDDKTSEPIGAKPKGVKLVVKVPAADTREARNKVSRHLAKNYGISAVKSIEYKGLEEQVSTGTDARTKIKNVARPDDVEPTSKESTLAKTGEIKTKKVDEGRSMSINRNFGLPESLIAATRALMEKKHDVDDMKSIGKNKTEVDTKPTTDDQVNDGDESNVKKKTKKLDPVGKEDDDIDNDGDVDKSDKYLHGRRKAIKKSMKEEAEQVNEAEIDGEHKIRWSRIGYHQHGLPKSGYLEKTFTSKEDAEKHIKKLGSSPIFQYSYAKKSMKEEAEQIDELKKSTLASYVNKAAPDAAIKSYIAGNRGGKGDHGPETAKLAAKASSRIRGVKLATSKLAKEEAEQVNEAIKIGSRVKIHAPGKDYHGIIGNVGEIDHGLHNKSEKRYTVDYNNRSKSVTVSKPQIKLHKEEFSDEELARLEEIAKQFD